MIIISIANPVVSESLSYSYMSVNFGLAFLFSTAAFWLLFLSECGEKKSQKVFTIVGAAFSLACSMAFYQAYIGVTCVLMLLYILSLINQEKQIKQIGWYIIKGLIVIACGGAMYWCITKLLLLRAGIEMAAYKGAGDISLSKMIISLPSSFVDCYKQYWNYLWNGKMNCNLEFSRIMIALVLVTALVLTIMQLVHLIKNKKIIYAIMSLISVLLLPCAACSVCLIAVGNSITGLMAMGIVFSIIMIYPAIGENFHGKILYAVQMCILAWFMISTVVNDQIALKEGTTATVSIANNSIEDIFENGYSSDSDCVAFVGIAVANPTFYQSVAYENANDYAKFGLWSTDARNNRTTWTGIAESLCGVNLNYCSDEKYNELVSSDIVADMPVYPEAGYIQVIDGITVVKISSVY